jgi:ribose 5-phosphate isomerase
MTSGGLSCIDLVVDGAAFHEKILASAADLLLIIGDSSKPVATLGRFPLPVEVVPFAALAIESRLVALGLKPIRRPSKADPTQPFVTEEGNTFVTEEGNSFVTEKGNSFVTEKGN